MPRSWFAAAFERQSQAPPTLPWDNQVSIRVIMIQPTAKCSTTRGTYASLSGVARRYSGTNFADVRQRISTTSSTDKLKKDPCQEAWTHGFRSRGPFETVYLRCFTQIIYVTIFGCAKGSRPATLR
jgi:hypothetical protein